MKLKITFLFIILGLLFFPSSLFAQQSVSLGVYPPILEIETDPPASVKANISIQNLSNQSGSYTIELAPFKDSGNLNGQTELTEANEVYKELFKKVQVQQSGHTIKEVTLSPGQKKDLNLHIGLPKGERIGDYYFSVLFISKSNVENLKNPSLGTRGGIALNVLLRVGPKQNIGGRITEFNAPGFVSKGPVEFNIKLLNTSETFTQAKGNIIIKNMFGQVIGQVDLLPVNVLANSQRLIPSKDSKELKDAIWNEKFLLGTYHADLTLALSEKGPILRKSVSFFAIPVEGILGIVISLAIVLVIIQRVRSKRQ